jgi:hypothetical protein
MATVSSPRGNLTDKLGWYTETRRHHVWDGFSAEERERMLRDDLDAGTRVSLVLASLITTGLVLSAVTLLAVVLWG